MSIKVCHLTSVHNRLDIRIFKKECCTLYKNGFDVTLLVFDGKKDEIKNGISIINLGKKNNESRIKRIIKSNISFYYQVKKIDPVIVHFHDPELIFLGIILKLRGFTVIFDIHENVKLQILYKDYLPKPFNYIVSGLYSLLDRFFTPFFDFLITATDSIKKNYSSKNNKIANINNYPIINEFVPPKYNRKKNELIFLGGLTEIRGIQQIVKSLKFTGLRLNLIGAFSDQSFFQKLKKLEEWDQVNYYGQCDRDKSLKILNESLIGIVTYLNYPNHIESQPTKLFEYMSSGIPVIASNFPKWEKIVNENQCGICVDPHNIDSIAKAINFLFKNKDKLEIMGKNGQKAIKDKFNWENESKKLIEIYEKLT